jgi:hypothetical protein
MFSPLFHRLVLVCSLPLLLPGGWCCLLGAAPLRPARQTAPQAAACPCCRPTGEPAPATPLPQQCPCAGRTTTPPPAAQPVSPDFSLATVLPASVLPCRLARGIRPAPTRPPATGPALHLRLCVWLC